MNLFIDFGKYDTFDSNGKDTDNNIESVHVKDEKKV